MRIDSCLNWPTISKIQKFMKKDIWQDDKETFSAIVSIRVQC